MTSLQQYKRFCVMIDKFSHDTNGNPTGMHTVFAYRGQGSVNNPSAELFASKRRAQIGYSDVRDDYAPDALKKAGIGMNTVKFVRKEGDRSEGAIYLIYDVIA